MGVMSDNCSNNWYMMELVHLVEFLLNFRKKVLNWLGPHCKFGLKKIMIRFSDNVLNDAEQFGKFMS